MIRKAKHTPSTRPGPPMTRSSPRGMLLVPKAWLGALRLKYDGRARWVWPLRLLSPGGTCPPQLMPGHCVAQDQPFGSETSYSA
jgi:hypothetical protein